MHFPLLGQMHEAGTNHSKYALPVYMQHDQDSHDFLPPLSRTTVRNLLEEYEDALASGSPLAIAIDEVSMLDAITFGRILKRVEEFESDYFETTPPRLFILVGNFCFMSDLLYTVHLIHFFYLQETFSKYSPAGQLRYTVLCWTMHCFRSHPNLVVLRIVASDFSHNFSCLGLTNNTGP